MTTPELSERAAEALRLAREDPVAATALARDVSGAASAGGRPDVESMALRALGLAARAQSRITAAVAHLRRAMDVAEGAGEMDLGAEARVSLASALAFAGESGDALEVLDGARPGPRVAAIVGVTRAGILTMLGRYDEALDGYDPAIEAFGAAGQDLHQARALTNRGLLHTYTGRFEEADADLVRAEQLLRSLGLVTEAAIGVHNRGFVATRRGDLPSALALFEQAEQAYTDAGIPPGALALDRAEALLAAGLVHDARTATVAALDHLRANGNRSGLAEGLVLLADVVLLVGDPTASQAAAEEAAALFGEQDRRTWAALARAAQARAVVAARSRSDATTTGSPPDTAALRWSSAANVAAEAALTLEQAGLRAEAVEAHASAGELCLWAGDGAGAERSLCAAAAGRRQGNARSRAVGWEAEAIRRLAAGDRAGSLAALRSSLQVVDEHQASLGASELRASSAIHARRTALRGLRLALEDGRPRLILTWMERRRANGLRSRTVTPPLGQPLAAWLDELRALSREIEQGATSATDVRPLLRRQAHLERSVRERAWIDTGTDSPAAAGARGGWLPAVVDALGERALVELAEIDGVVHAVVVTAGRARHVVVGPVSPITAELGHLRMALRASAYRVGDGDLAGAASRLDDLLLAPLGRLLGDRPVVLVPTGELHAAPWSVLPTLAGRPAAVAPSARAWLDAATRPLRPRSRALVVAGPGLPWARQEVEGVRRQHPAAEVLADGDARSGAVLAGLSTCDLAHVAAHATFRADNGLWSSLTLDDGPLSVYEVEKLPRAPQLVVLSACQSGLSTVRPGDELLGLVAGLLAAGTAAVIASVVPVADAATMPLMVDLHRRLAAGDAPGVALAGAQQAAADQVVAGSFVCFGAG